MTFRISGTVKTAFSIINQPVSQRMSKTKIHGEENDMSLENAKKKTSAPKIWKATTNGLSMPIRKTSGSAG